MSFSVGGWVDSNINRSVYSQVVKNLCTHRIGEILRNYQEVAHLQASEVLEASKAGAGRAAVREARLSEMRYRVILGMASDTTKGTPWSSAI